MLGSNAHGGPEPVDAEIVTRLRAAGAIVVGITRTPELAAWPFTETVAGGITRNPWDPDRTPGGSSGGSAAAVSAALVPAATASDGAGSIRIPAACCGLFGMKTTRGVVPTGPYDEVFGGLAVYGVLTRTVADAALLYEVLTGSPFVAAAQQDPAAAADRAVDADPARQLGAACTGSGARPPRRRRSCCARSATRSSSASRRSGRWA